ncbi:hypothetical protein J2S36_000990 [Arcanobacterium hippocoleae]|uniref:Uncharacterized protein n=1 Tax=Arcanobacterium hippocoleae TaxID=149017 RepID=A0ABU1T243_9ACTO|nr:hypothetical protein [Arcanobacterium hippocoleae]
MVVNASGFGSLSAADGAVECHDCGDDAVDLLSVFCLSGLMLPAGSWRIRTLSINQTLLIFYLENIEHLVQDEKTERLTIIKIVTIVETICAHLIFTYIEKGNMQSPPINKTAAVLIPKNCCLLKHITSAKSQL